MYCVSVHMPVVLVHWCLATYVCVHIVHATVSTLQHCRSGPCSAIRSFYDIWFTRAVRQPCGVSSLPGIAYTSTAKSIETRTWRWEMHSVCVCVCMAESVCVCVCVWMAEAEPGADSSCNTHDLHTHTKPMLKEGIRWLATENICVCVWQRDM